VDELNRAVVRGAVGLGLENGSQLRVDTTAVETDIHYPTDSALLWDGVRVICRLVEQLGERASEAAQGFSDHRRRARRRMQEISRMRDRRGKRRRSWRQKYRDLLWVSDEVVHSAAEVVERARSVRLADPLDAIVVAVLAEEIVRYSTLLARVIDQTRRRVFAEETVPSDQKVYSLFEPHTDLIKRGKARKPVEFGHKVFLAESRSGLITDYQILDGNPPDERQVEDSLKRHTGLFGHLPDLYAGDRGFDGAHKRQAETDGVTMCIPQRGGQRTPERAVEEKSRRFKSGQRFRAGIEGRISVLFRGRGMKRCRLHGRERFEVFIAAAVLANNLLIIAARLERKDRRKNQTSLRLAA
jgi:IS5 family transposase